MPNSDTVPRVEIVRCLWFGAHFSGEELRTRRGGKLEVLSPGWWNVDPGPSFRRAEIDISGGEFPTITAEPVSIEVFEKTSDVPEFPAALYDMEPPPDFYVIWGDDQPDRKLYRPAVVLSEFCDSDIRELVNVLDSGGN